MQANQQNEYSLPGDWSRLWVSTVRDYAVIGLSADGTIETWNVGAETSYGFKGAEVIGQSLEQLHTLEERETNVLAAELDTARRTGHAEAEGWRIRKDGSRFWASVVTTLLKDREGHALGFGKVVRDMTDKRRAYDAVVESEQRFRTLVDGVTDFAIFMLSPGGFVKNWNAGARRIKGYSAEEIVGSHFSRFYTPEDAAARLPQRGLALAAQEGRFEAQGWRVRKNGERFWAHVVIDAIRDRHGALAGFAKVTRDITEQKDASSLREETRKALFQLQKLEALRELTGGVTHNLNNLLQVLRDDLDMLGGRHYGDAWTRARIARGTDAVERGSKLSSQLVAFGRQQPLHPAVIDLSAALHGVADHIRRALDGTIHVETVVAAGLWSTLVDLHQLEKVILNLAINARDAMPQGGKLTIGLSNALLDNNSDETGSDVATGQYVLLTVTDTGTGMPANAVDRAFEPFFTNNAAVHRTGLGLSEAYGFVKQSHGHIRIRSEMGHGTTVKVYLPRSSKKKAGHSPG